MRDNPAMQSPTPLPPGGAPLALVPAATLPHNIEAEAALLGALMIDNRLVEDVQLKLGSRSISSSRSTAGSMTRS